MGTETSPPVAVVIIIGTFIVKLNNPLMGTETSEYSASLLHEFLIAVKLNNPLMGTETSIARWYSIVFDGSNS